MRKTLRGIPSPTDELRKDLKSHLERWVIVGGSTMAGSSKKAKKMYLCMVHSIQISGWPPKATRLDNPAISFSEEDVRQLHHPYDNALVINLSIADFNTRWVLIDNGSSVDIFHYSAF